MLLKQSSILTRYIGYTTRQLLLTHTSVSYNLLHVRHYAEESKLTDKFKGSRSIDDVLLLTKDKLYFPRVRHLQLLQNIIDSNKPQGIIPVIGPPSVGKSTFLRNALKGRLTAHIDLRKQGVVSTVDDFIRVLQRQFLTWESVSHEISDKFKSLFGGMQLFGVDVPKEQSSLGVRNFTQLLRLLDELLSDIKTIHKPEKLPVLFLDDAHKLYYLLDQPMGKEILTTFFDWCVSITKADNLCHVIVACSDGLFVRWLQNEFGLASHLRTVLVSDLSKPKAFQFVESCLSAVKENDNGGVKAEEKIPEEEVEKVYSVVGGNIYHLRTWALDFLSGVSAETALGTLVANSERQIRDAFSPSMYVDTYVMHKHKALWTTGHWITILKALAQSSSGYLPYYKVLHEVFNGNAAVLHSLIYMQLLHYRPTHIRSVAMQRDHDDQVLEPMIGVPSTVFLYATRKVLQSLPNPLLMISVAEGNQEGYVDIAIPPEKFTIEGITELISKEFGRKPEELQNLIILSSKTKMRRDYDLNRLGQNEKLKADFTSNKFKVRFPRIDS